MYSNNGLLGTGLRSRSDSILSAKNSNWNRWRDWFIISCFVTITRINGQQLLTNHATQCAICNGVADRLKDAPPYSLLDLQVTPVKFSHSLG